MYDQLLASLPNTDTECIVFKKKPAAKSFIQKIGGNLKLLYFRQAMRTQLTE